MPLLLHARPGATPGMPQGPGWRHGATIVAASLVGAALLSACSADTVTVADQRIAQVLVAANGRRVEAPATGGGCTRSVRLTAVETARVVTLRLTTRDVAPAGDGCSSVGIAMTAATTLRAPLAGRSVVDAYDHRAVPVFDGRRLAAARWLPAGVTPAPDDAQQVGSWIRVYDGAPGSRDAQLQIAQSRGNTLAEDQRTELKQERSTTVQGHPARLLIQSHHRVLETDALFWRANGYTYEVLSAITRRGQSAQPVTVLQHVARRLDTDPQTDDR
jgi:hypothetical protein